MRRRCNGRGGGGQSRLGLGLGTGAQQDGGAMGWGRNGTGVQWDGSIQGWPPFLHSAIADRGFVRSRRLLWLEVFLTWESTQHFAPTHLNR